LYAMESRSWGVRRDGRLRLFLGVWIGESVPPDARRVFKLCDEVDFGDSVLTLAEFGLAFEVDEAVARAYDGGAIFWTGGQQLQIVDDRIHSQYQICRIIVTVNACGGVEEACMTTTAEVLT
jgi:hypothetical protein